MRADATAPSVAEFMKEIGAYATGISDEELRFLQTSVGQSDALKYETGQQKAAFLSRIVEYNLPTTFVDEQSQILRKLTKADVQASAQKYLPANRMYIVVVGDRAKVFPGLGQVGYEVVELDLEGNRVAAAAAPASQAAPAPGPTGEKTPMKSEDGDKIKVKAKPRKG